MVLRRSVIASVFLATACAGMPGASRSTPSRLPDSNGFPADSSIQAMLKEVVFDPGTTGMVVGTIEPDGRRRVIAYGSAGAGKGPLDGESVFEIGSITKGFTGVLLADMARRGEVQLAEPLGRLLPPGTRTLSRNGTEVTLLHLATHTSGLPVMPANFPAAEDANAYAGYAVEQMYDFLSHYRLTRNPGEKYEYSNLFSVVGHLLAQRAGKPFDVLLRERVLAPLGMKHTSLAHTPAMEPHRTQGHHPYGDPVPYFVTPAFATSGGLRSTAHDLLAFAAANLSADTAGIYGALRDSRHPRWGPINEDGDYSALAWGTDSLGHVFGHSGATFGYNSYIYVNVAQQRALVVLANTGGNTANQVGVRLLEPGRHPRLKPSAGMAVVSAYRRAGVERAVEEYRTLRRNAPDRWNFDQFELNSVGYWLLGRGAAADAVAIFQLNVEAYPQEPNPHDSLGDAYLAAGRQTEAVESYGRAVALAEAANDPALESYRSHLERARQQPSPR